jgi:hypothetical protein
MRALPIPNSEKKFMWRAINNILPTKDNLYRKKIIQGSDCPPCGLKPETNSHILWQCSSTRDVRLMGNKKLQKSATTGECFREVVENLFDKCSQEDRVLFAGLARHIWLRRNDVVFGGVLSSPNNLFQRTQQSITEFQLAQG